jgi:CRP-like cAMP-binding protein
MSPSHAAKRILKATPLFAALDDAELTALAGRCGMRSYAPGEVLFAEDDPCAGLYIVVSGRIRIFKTASSGREQVLAVEAGSFRRRTARIRWRTLSGIRFSDGED